YMPKVEHDRAAEQPTECSVYRSVKEQSEQKISYNRKVLGESMRALELARRDLDACASSKGVSSTGGEKEVLIAELCPGLYESWLRPSYKVRMVAQDLR